jgi:hypothetical protein
MAGTGGAGGTGGMAGTGGTGGMAGTGGTGGTGGMAGMNVSFSVDILPYFGASQENCVRCHGPGQSRAGVRLDSYTSIVVDGGDSGPLVVPGDSTDPSAILIPQMQSGHQNPSNVDAFIVILSQWIDEGALDN